MLSAITIAFKVIAGVLVRLITGPMGIPGGALAGGFYMLWMPLGVALINKRGTALLIALVQAIVLLITGLPGSHGFMSFVTYSVPALAVELIMLIKRNEYNILHFILSVIVANIIGTFGSNLLFFRISWLPLVFTLVAAAMSGAFGGVVGYFTYTNIKKTSIMKYYEDISYNNEENISDEENKNDEKNNC